MTEREGSSTWMNCDGLGGVPEPAPWMGSQATASRTIAAMRQAPKPPPPVVLWWEGLETWLQLALSFPVFAVLTFLLNVGPFNQAILRSVFYGLFEGAVLSGLLAIATRTERDRRSK